jgi:hypothetical protein
MNTVLYPLLAALYGLNAGLSAAGGQGWLALVWGAGSVCWIVCACTRSGAA